MKRPGPKHQTTKCKPKSFSKKKKKGEKREKTQKATRQKTDNISEMATGLCVYHPESLAFCQLA